MSQEAPPGPPPESPPPGFAGYFPPPGPPAGRGIPWDRRNEIGLVSALVETTKEVLTGPGDFFQRMPVTGGVGSPMLYAVIMGYLGVLVSAVYSAVFLLVGGVSRGAFRPLLTDRPELGRMAEMLSGWAGIVWQVIFAPFGIVIGLFVGAGIAHVILLLLDGAGEGFEATFRAVSFSYAAQVLAIVPLCGGLLAGIYSLVLWIIGLAAAQRIPVWKAAVAVLLPLFLCCCCCALGGFLMAGSIASLVNQAR